MAEALLKSGSTRSAVLAVCLAVSGVNHPMDEYRIHNWLRFFLEIIYSFSVCKMLSDMHLCFVRPT